MSGYGYECPSCTQESSRDHGCDCIQPDGSGYYIVSEGTVAEWCTIRPQDCAGLPAHLAIDDIVLCNNEADCREEEPYGFRENFDWLAREAQSGSGGSGPQTDSSLIAFGVSLHVDFWVFGQADISWRFPGVECPRAAVDYVCEEKDGFGPYTAACGCKRHEGRWYVKFGNLDLRPGPTYQFADANFEWRVWALEWVIPAGIPIIPCVVLSPNGDLALAESGNIFAHLIENLIEVGTSATIKIPAQSAADMAKFAQDMALDASRAAQQVDWTAVNEAAAQHGIDLVDLSIDTAASIDYATLGQQLSRAGLSSPRLASLGVELGVDLTSQFSKKIDWGAVGVPLDRAVAVGVEVLDTVKPTIASAVDSALSVVPTLVTASADLVREGFDIVTGMVRLCANDCPRTGLTTSTSMSYDLGPVEVTLTVSPTTRRRMLRRMTNKQPGRPVSLLSLPEDDSLLGDDSGYRQPARRLLEVALVGGRLHDGSKCSDVGNDCCAHADWSEPKTCSDGYVAIPTLPAEAPWCVCPGYDGGSACYGCYLPPGTLHVTVQAWTATKAYADTTNNVFISFFVDGLWTTEELFLSGASKGVHTIFSSSPLPGVPAKMKLRIDGSNGWGFWKLRLTVNGLNTYAIGLDSTQAGEECSPSGRHWLDGGSDSCSQPSLEWDVPAFGDAFGTHTHSHTHTHMHTHVCPAVLIHHYIGCRL